MHHAHAAGGIEAVLRHLQFAILLVRPPHANEQKPSYELRQDVREYTSNHFDIRDIHFNLTYVFFVDRVENLVA